MFSFHTHVKRSEFQFSLLTLDIGLIKLTHQHNVSEGICIGRSDHLISFRSFPNSEEQPRDAVDGDVRQDGGGVSDRRQTASFGGRV